MPETPVAPAPVSLPPAPTPPEVIVPAPPVRPPDDLGQTDPHIEREHLRLGGLTGAPLPGLSAAPLPGGADRPRGGSRPAPTQTRPAAAEPADPIEALLARHGTSGAFLRGVREHRGMDLEALAAATRISTRYLGAIEEDGFDRLPAATFVRGYLKQIASVLEVGEHGVVEGYMALYAQRR